MAISGLTLTLEEHEQLLNENALRFADDWIKSIETNNEKEFQSPAIGLGISAGNEFIETTINELFAGEFSEFSDYVSNDLFQRLEQVLNVKNIDRTPYIKLKEHAFKLINDYQYKI
jgi:hypothetical protein